MKPLCFGAICCLSSFLGALPACSKARSDSASDATVPTMSSDGGRSDADGVLARISGRWSIVEYDGMKVDDKGVAGSDPRDVSTYMAGGAIEFEEGRFRMSHGAVKFEKRMKIVRLEGPDVVIYDIGYGPSKLELLEPNRIRVHIESIPSPHVAVLRRS